MVRCGTHTGREPATPKPFSTPESSFVGARSRGVLYHTGGEVNLFGCGGCAASVGTWLHVRDWCDTLQSCRAATGKGVSRQHRSFHPFAARLTFSPSAFAGKIRGVEARYGRTGE